MYKVFIDGSAGTTGLKILDRLSSRDDLTIIALPENLRKDVNARKEALNSADVAFLCLPDTAAIESVSLITNKNVRVIDTSTAHRVNPYWTYGFAELTGRRELIKNSNRIANPGCHASGFISLVAPLVENKLIDKDIALTCFSITGYSGGGKKMIAEYEGQERNELFDAPRQYGLSQMHKHLPEMQSVCNLQTVPIFCPIVSDYNQGMEVTVPLFKKDLKGNINDLKELYKSIYTTKVVTFNEQMEENGFLSANKMKGKDSLEIGVFGNEDRILLVSRFDNLGKGASGAAIQNMNIALGVDELKGLIV
mgnify:CR=1 FL=1